MLPALQLQRPGSQGSSSSSAAPNNGKSGIALAVALHKRTSDIIREIRAGQAALEEENKHMEEILSEEHHMVSNNDISHVLCNLFVEQRRSAILAARRPVERRKRFRKLCDLPLRKPDPLETHQAPVMEGDAAAGLHKYLEKYSAMEDTRARLRHEDARLQRGVLPIPGPRTSASPNYGKVNYSILLEQQRDMHSEIERNHVGYKQMVSRHIRNQENFGV
jgi:hypothetical protein